MIKGDRFTYRVTWSEEDQEYLALCTEFPSLSWLGQSPENALIGLRELVASIIKDLQENQEPVPIPISIQQFSGKFTVRIPPELHRRLTFEATEAGISLNRLANEKLSRPVSE
jgi:predicted HicB family RNase H-like nuclease